MVPCILWVFELTTDTYRSIVESLLICNLVGIGAIGIFVVFALESRVSRRDDYLKALCHGLDLYRGLLKVPNEQLDENAQRYLNQVKRLIRGSKFQRFFEPANAFDRKVFGQMDMERYIRFLPDRYMVLRSFVRDILAEGRKHSGVRFPGSEGMAVFVLSEAWHASSSFEDYLRAIKNQVWLPWAVGVASIAFCIVLLHFTDLCQVWPQGMLLRCGLGSILLLTAAEFTAMTVSIHRILYRLDR